MGQGGGALPRGYPWPPPGFVVEQGPAHEPPDPELWKRCTECGGHGWDDEGRSCGVCRTTGWEKRKQEVKL